MLKHEPRVRDLIALAAVASSLTPPADSDITETLDSPELTSTKTDLVEGLNSTIELAKRIIAHVEQPTHAT